MSLSKETDVSKLLGPLKCGGCTACCRSGLAVVLMPPDDVNSYDSVMAPPPAGAVQSLPEEALFPIEALEKLPPEATAHYRKDGHRFLVLQLKRRENGDCVYLSESGCTIYERRPSACRAFDCREIFLGQTRNQRREWIKSGMMSREVYAAGRQRTTKTP
jgi:Fe-S-cluster containining protein